MRILVSTFNKYLFICTLSTTQQSDIVQLTRWPIKEFALIQNIIVDESPFCWGSGDPYYDSSNFVLYPNGAKHINNYWEINESYDEKQEWKRYSDPPTGTCECMSCSGPFFASHSPYKYNHFPRLSLLPVCSWCLTP